MSIQNRLPMISAWVCAVLLTVLGVTSCNQVVPPNPAANDTPAPSGANATANPANQTAAFDFTAGFDQLKSYQVDFLDSSRGQLDGKPYETRIKISRKVVIQPSSEDSIIDDLLDDGSPYYLQYIRLGDATYFQEESAGDCQGTANREPSGQIPNPVELLPQITGAEKVGAETLVGLPATHYRFDGKDLGVDADAVSGDFWLADSNGLVLKYQLEQQAFAQPSGTGLEVQRTVQYQLSQIDQIAQVDLPAECIPVLSGIPAMPDAVNLERSSASMSYTTGSNSSQVADFYDQSLAKLGWKSSHEPGAAADDGLLYLKDPQILSVIFYQGDSGLEVDVLLRDPSYHFSEAASVPSEVPTPGPSPTTEPTPTFDMTQSGLPADVPLYPGASGVQAVAGKGLTFKSSDSAAQIASFYMDQLKNRGWKLVNTTSAAAIIQQTWIKGKTTLNISIQDGKDTRTVLILTI